MKLDCNSKLERRRRKLNIIDQKQPKLTDYFPLLNEIELLMQQNAKLESTITKFISDNNIRENNKAIENQNDLLQN